MYGSNNDWKYTYGMGVVIKGNWLLQDPLCNGYSALEAYLPSQRIAISLVVTFGEGAFDTTTGSYPNEAVPISSRSARSWHPTTPRHRLPGIRPRPPAAKAPVACSPPRDRALAVPAMSGHDRTSIVCFQHADRPVSQQQRWQGECPGERPGFAQRAMLFK